jgi:hypothetical protein
MAQTLGIVRLPPGSESTGTRRVDREPAGIGAIVVEPESHGQALVVEIRLMKNGNEGRTGNPLGLDPFGAPATPGTDVAFVQRFLLFALPVSLPLLIPLIVFFGGQIRVPGGWPLVLRGRHDRVPGNGGEREEDREEAERLHRQRSLLFNHPAKPGRCQFPFERRPPVGDLDGGALSPNPR